MLLPHSTKYYTNITGKKINQPTLHLDELDFVFRGDNG